jgi:hypothetical protein
VCAEASTVLRVLPMTDATLRMEAVHDDLWRTFLIERERERDRI